MVMMNGGYEFMYLCSSPTFNVMLPVPRSLATEGGQAFCTSLFSLANKNLLPSGAGTDTVGLNNRFVLNTCTIMVYDSDTSENSYKLFLTSKAPSIYIYSQYTLPFSSGFNQSLELPLLVSLQHNISIKAL
jgi:hypothetical protein